MQVSDSDSSDRRSVRPERIWPLDIPLIVVSAVLLYLVFIKLRFDDPRMLYSGRLYAIAVPVIALLIGLSLRGIASRYVQKSAQLGFLFSVTVHLLLLIIAFQWVIFPLYYPEPVAGVKPERSPVRRTVPEYVFRNMAEPKTQPDWSKPVDAEAAARVVPEQPREVVPAAKPSVNLEVPTLREPEPSPPQLFAIDRATASASAPKPADVPTRRNRRSESSDSRPPPASRLPDAPTIATTPDPALDPAQTERPETLGRRSARPRFTASIVLPDAPAPEPDDRSSVSARRQLDESPSVLGPRPPRPTTRQSSPGDSTPAGSSPNIPSVAVARDDSAAPRTLTPMDFPLTRTRPRERSGAVVGEDEPLLEAAIVSPSAGRAEAARDLVKQAATTEELPTVAVSDPASAQRSSPTENYLPAGLPELPEVAVVPDVPVSPGDDAKARVAIGEPQRRAPAGRALEIPLEPVELPLEPGVAKQPREDILGRGTRVTDETGVVPAIEQPKVASLDLSRERRERRTLGGPASPAGSKITAVKPFNRRVMRTQGGAAPAPAGMVGPATEEAIERGLAYLADRQQDDGSWSLEGHGGEVLLRSDTAATGLAILAFQGAGYTHRQHQYAGNVARAIEFLVDHQRSNGDLYIPQDAASNQNAALYSHGIAALAICEAFGMTQDPELEEPAQLAINYIAATQHRELGGWRYTPQISADTSVSGWMMMALKSGELAGLTVAPRTYRGVNNWLAAAQAGPRRPDRYRYNPFAPDNPAQRHGRTPTPTMTAVGMLMRMYLGWSREQEAMQSAAEYLLDYPPSNGTINSPQRDTYYWYYATQVMFHMGGEYWDQWNQSLNPVLLDTQVKRGPDAGSWNPLEPVPDRWSRHAGRLYLTTMNLLNLEVYYRHLPIYEDSAE